MMRPERNQAHIIVREFSEHSERKSEASEALFIDRRNSPCHILIQSKLKRPGGCNFWRILARALLGQEVASFNALAYKLQEPLGNV